jgi:repressor LexA
MYDLTKRQREVLEYIVQYTFEHLYQPSLREICGHIKVSSTNAVSDHLRALERKGFLTGSKNARALEFSDDALLFVKSSDHLRARPIVLVKQ